jgi:hypothetical protein
MKKEKVSVKIEESANRILEEYSNGLSFTELKNKISSERSDLGISTIHTQIPFLPKNNPETYYQPARGIYRLTKFKEDGEVEELKPTVKSEKKTLEKDYYELFVKFITEEIYGLEECTKAMSLGGASNKLKYATPDVIGIFESKRTDVFTFPPEFVSAEIKAPNGDPAIVGIGQACAYKLFSHKSYLVVPKLPDEMERIESLCILFGLGLVFINPTKDPNKDDPGEIFELKVRAQKTEPDYYWLNKMIHENDEIRKFLA